MDIFYHTIFHGRISFFRMSDTEYPSSRQDFKGAAPNERTIGVSQSPLVSGWQSRCDAYQEYLTAKQKWLIRFCAVKTAFLPLPTLLRRYTPVGRSCSSSQVLRDKMARCSISHILAVKILFNQFFQFLRHILLHQPGEILVGDACKIIVFRSILYRRLR